MPDYMSSKIELNGESLQITILHLLEYRYPVGLERVGNFDTESGMTLEEKNQYRVGKGSGCRDDAVKKLKIEIIVMSPH